MSEVPLQFGTRDCMLMIPGVTPDKNSSNGWLNAGCTGGGLNVIRKDK